MRRLFLASTLLLAVAVPATAGEIAGVTMPDTVKVEGTTLTLNGMGIRKKLFIKVYVGGLYLPAKAADATAILAADSPRRLEMHFLYSEVSAAKLVAAWREGFDANSKAQLPALQQRLDTFCGWWPAMKSGERAELTYQPGLGTRLIINGADKGVIPGADFARALFAVWLGDIPADKGLKQGLLGL